MSTKKYSKEFKFNAVSLVIEQVHTQTAAAKSTGLNSKRLHSWVKGYKKDEEASFTDQGK